MPLIHILPLLFLRKIWSILSFVEFLDIQNTISCIYIHYCTTKTNKTVHGISEMHIYFCRSLGAFIMQINVTRWEENGCGQLDAL